MVSRLKRRSKSKLTTVLILFFFAICLLGLVYLVVALYYSRHFFPNTVVNHRQIGNKTAAKVKEELSKDIESHNLVLVERQDKTELIKAEEIEVKLDYKDEIEKAIASQNHWKWPRRVFHVHKVHFEPELSYNEEKLEKKIADLEVMNPEKEIKPKSARITLKEDQFYIVRETKGNRVKKKTLAKRIKEYINQSKTELNLEEEGCYSNPKFSATDQKVKQALMTARKYAQTSIIYELDGESLLLDASEINGWIVVDSDMKVSIDKEKVSVYVGELGRQYNTVGEPIRFVNHSGQSLTLDGGSYGYEIDEDAETKKIIEEIQSGGHVSRKPVYSHEPPSNSTSGYWSTYVEISLEEQHMWMIKNGQEIVSTSIVTGDVTKGNGTPSGAYSVFYKERDATLDGEGYSSPVDYWIAFNNNIGIHDASWRSNYGGTIYRGNGSHGCVNTPYQNAKTIYENTELGTPVFVY